MAPAKKSGGMATALNNVGQPPSAVVPWHSINADRRGRLSHILQTSRAYRGSGK